MRGPLAAFFVKRNANHPARVWRNTIFFQRLAVTGVRDIFIFSQALLTYHYPHQQTLLSLEADSESLQDVIKKSDITWPWFVKENLLQGNAEMAWQLGSNLAPEQQTIVTEADNSTVSVFSIAGYS
ncbi:hypothetical protein AH074_002308 [Salmonella enterica subsp. houtenae]|nr:hypothetical protein [Salmonella enterica subsp. houtenae]MIG54970.1 hypothetical protein [Salmonella enterica subsp. houtenae]